MRTAVFKLCGQPEIGPMGVLDQSNERILSPSSPPPERISSGDSRPAEPADDSDPDMPNCDLGLLKQIAVYSYSAPGLTLYRRENPTLPFIMEQPFFGHPMLELI